jgi:hypothetical protein
VYIAADAKDPNDVNVYRMRKYFATYIKVHWRSSLAPNQID